MQQSALRSLAIVCDYMETTLFAIVCDHMETSLKVRNLEKDVRLSGICVPLTINILLKVIN